MSEQKERILKFEITGTVQGKNLIRENKINLCAEREVLKQFLYGVLEEVLKNIEKTEFENVRCKNHTIN